MLAQGVAQNKHVNKCQALFPGLEIRFWGR